MSCRNLVPLIFAGAFTLGLLGVILPDGLVGPARAQGTAAKTTLASGKVTAVGTTTIRIERTEYPLDQKVTVTDLLGRRRSLNEVQPGQDVRFHVEKGRIDQIVLILPS